MIRFVYPEENSKVQFAVNAILNKAKTLSNNEDLKDMIGTWFKLMDYESWSNKSGHYTENLAVENVYEVETRSAQHGKWIKENKIAFTPTLFLNGRILPRRYFLHDIDQFLPQIAELILEKNIQL